MQLPNYEQYCKKCGETIKETENSRDRVTPHHTWHCVKCDTYYSNPLVRPKKGE